MCADDQVAQISCIAFWSSYLLSLQFLCIFILVSDFKSHFIVVILDVFIATEAESIPWI